MPGIAHSKTVLVIGATAGIGRALALAIHDLPSKPTVIIVGRRTERLESIVNEGDPHNEGRLKSITVNIDDDRNRLKSFAETVLSQYPDLDTVLFSAGVQHYVDFTKPETIDMDLVQSETNINYVAIFTLIKYFMPHFLKLSSQGRPSFIIPVTSGLGIVPKPHVPNYCAMKAALHSLCLTLTAQLENTNVHVMEIIPTLTESELHDHQGMTPKLAKFWVPLSEFVPLTMKGLEKGESYIVATQIQREYDQFEKGKYELVIKSH